MEWIRKHKGPIKEEIGLYLENLIIAELEKFPASDITVCIGTDSQRKHGGYTYATAVILVTKGKGGKIISRKSFEKGKIELVRRMTKEVMMSIMTAYELKDLFDKYDINIEIHADINQNPKHDSNKALKEAVSQITAMGGYFNNYSYRVKPDAWASSTGADKLCQ
jgi:uncharacterized protein